MTCRNCDAPVDAGAHYCPKCGFPQANRGTPTSQSSHSTTSRPSSPPQPDKMPTLRSGESTSTTTGVQSDKISEPLPLLRNPGLSSKQTGDLVHVPQRPLAQLPEQTAMMSFSQNQISASVFESHKRVDKQVQLSSRTQDQQQNNNAAQLQDPTLHIRAQAQPQMMSQQRSQETPMPEMAMSPLPPPSPLLYYRLNPSRRRGRQMHHSGVVTKTSPYTRRRSSCGCMLGCLTLLILLIVIVGAGWIFAIRPQVSAMVQNQLDSALTTAVNQLPTDGAKLPAKVTLQENTINNLIVLNLAPSNPVKNPQTVITPDNIRLSFQTYNLPSTITLVPQVQNGRVVASNVTVQGAAGLVMTPEELATVLNRHLSDAQTRIKRSVNNIQLRDHEMDITFA